MQGHSRYDGLMAESDWIQDELSHLEDRNLLRQRVVRSGKLGPEIVVDGRRFVNFASNDYLGMAADPALPEVVSRTVLRGGWGSGASPLVVGRSAVHAELERRLAKFLGCEAALLFPTGFAANLGTIPVLVGNQDLIFSDEKNHASIIDGCRLSQARTVIYPHGDHQRLAELVAAKSARRKLIVTDGLFSMDGDLAPLDELADIAQTNDALIMVDEAHALGVIGPAGRGAAAHFDVVDRVAIRVGTLSKSFGSHGGFVAGSRALIDLLANRARSYVFSTAGPVASAAVALAAMHIMRDEPGRRERLLQMSNHVRQQLRAQGWDTGRSESHIVPVVIGDSAKTVQCAEQLRESSLWVPAIRPPSVPPGGALLRISLSSAHTDGMIDRLLTSVAKLRHVSS
jgi:8-amino-7-oxononanoate synthase